MPIPFEQLNLRRSNSPYMQPIISPSANLDKYGTGYYPIISSQPYERDILRYKIDNQPDWDKFGNMLVRGAAKFGVSMIEPIPYLLDVQQYMSDINEVEDQYGNFANTKLREFEQYLDEQFPIYTEDKPGIVFDRDWWFKNGDQILKSAGYFVPGMGITKGATLALKGASRALQAIKFGEKALKLSDTAIRFGGVAAGAIAQNYGEHMYSAAMAFEQNTKDFYEKIKSDNPTISDEEAWTEAKKQAAPLSEGIVKKGKINLLLNMIELNNLVKLQNLTRSASVNFHKKALKEIFETAGSEYAEEVNTGIFENEAQRQADIYTGKILDDGSTPLDRALKHYASYEGLTEGLLGAIGGAGMQIVSELTSLGSRKQARAMENKLKSDYKTFDDLNNKNRNDFITSLFHSAQTGTYDTMMAVLEDIRNTDDATAQQKNYRPDFREVTDEYIDIAKNFELEYNNTLHKYSENPDMGLSLVNLRTNRDVNRREALKTEGLINEARAGYTEAEKQHPLFGAKDLYLKSQAIQTEIADIDSDIDWLNNSKEFDRTLDKNENLEELTKRRESAIARLEEFKFNHNKAIADYYDTRSKELRLNVPFAPGQLTEKEIGEKISTEVDEYLRQLNSTDNTLKSLYQKLGIAQSTSAVAAKTVSELERSNKKLAEYVDRNNQAEKKIRKELVDKVNAAKTQEELDALKKEYTHPRFASVFTKRAVEIKKEVEKAKAKEKVDKNKPKEEVKPEVKPETKDESELPFDNEDEEFAKFIEKVTKATQSELDDIRKNTDESKFTKEQLDRYTSAYNDRANELSQDEVIPFSSGSNPVNNPTDTTVPTRDDSGRETLNIASLLDKDGTTFNSDEEAVLMNSRMPNTETSFVQSLLDGAMQEDVYNLRNTVKSLDELLTKPAFKNEKVKTYWEARLVNPLKDRLATMEKDIKSAEEVVGKEELINTPPVDIEENYNPSANTIRTVVDPFAKIEEEKFKRLQIEPVITLGTLHHEYILNIAFQKKTASNIPNLRYVKAISSSKFFLPGTKLRLSIDKNDERYKDNKDDYLNVPIKVEALINNTWIPTNMYVHVFEWINSLNVPFEKIDDARKQMIEVRKAITDILQKEDYVYSSIEDKLGGYPLYNIKEDKLNDEKVVVVDPNNNPAIEQLPLSEAMPDPNLTFVMIMNGAWYIGKNNPDSELANTTEDLAGQSGIVRVKVIDPAGNIKTLPISINRLGERTDIMMSIRQVIKAFYSKDQATLDLINNEYAKLGSNTRITIDNSRSLFDYINTFINFKQFKGSTIILNPKVEHARFHIGFNNKNELVFGNDFGGVHTIKDKKSFDDEVNKLDAFLAEKLMSVRVDKINSTSKVYEVLINHNNEVVKAVVHEKYNDFVKTFTETFFNGRNKVGDNEYTYFVNPQVRMSLDFMPKDNVNLNNNKITNSDEEDINEEDEFENLLNEYLNTPEIKAIFNKYTDDPTISKYFVDNYPELYPITQDVTDKSLLDNYNKFTSDEKRMVDGFINPEKEYYNLVKYYSNLLKTGISESIPTDLELPFNITKPTPPPIDTSNITGEEDEKTFSIVISKPNVEVNNNNNIKHLTNIAQEEKTSIDNANVIEEIVNPKSDLNTKLINFLSELGVTVEERESLLDRTGYNILSATDLLTKTIILHNRGQEKSIPKEAAYLIFQFLGKKNILRKDLIASIPLLEDYNNRLRKYDYSKLSDYKKRELVVIDYIHDQLINNFEKPVVLNKVYESRDATAKTKLEYLILKLKQWWNDIVRNYFKNYKRNEVKGMINQIAQDVLDNNYRLFATNIKQSDTPMDGDAELEKNPKMKEIFNNLKGLGFIPTGSYALSKQGTIYRSSMKDLDFSIPFEIASKETWLEDIKSIYPNVIVYPAYSNIYNFNITQTIKIDDVAVDLFIYPTIEENYYVTEEGVQNWESIFDAKIRIGSKKHLNDLFNFTPSKKVNNFRRGMRHFNFDWIQSNFNRKYENDKVGNNADQKNTNLFTYPEEAILRAKSFLISEGLLEDGKVYERDGNESKHFQALFLFHRGNFDNAIVDFYKTFSRDFASWYGKLEARLPNTTHTFKFGNPKYYNKPSIFIDNSGAPMVLYHGTGTTFDTFNKEYFNTGEGAMVYGAGFYGTTYKPTADQYAKTSKALEEKIKELIFNRDEKLLKVIEQLNMNVNDPSLEDSLIKLVPNLIGSHNDIVTSEDQRKYELIRDLLGLHETKNLYIHLTNPLDWFSPIRSHIRNIVENNFKINIESNTEGELYNELAKKLNISTTELSSRLYNIGIDGTIHETRGGTTGAGVQHSKDEIHFVIFEPIQAKAVNNSGLFSKTNANMYDPISDNDLNFIGSNLSSHITSNMLININKNLASSNIINKQYTIDEFNLLPKEEQEYLIKCWS